MTNIVSTKILKYIMAIAITCELLMPLSMLNTRPEVAAKFVPVYYMLCALTTAIITLCYFKTPKTTRQTDAVKALTLAGTAGIYGIANIIAYLVTILTTGLI